MKLVSFRILYIIALFAVITISACYYDNEAELYPSAPPKTNVSYINDINPIIINKCNVCHATAIRQGNIATETYTELKTHVDNGSLLGSIKHSSSFKAMPQGSAKLPTAQIQLIETWITEGAKNN